MFLSRSDRTNGPNSLAGLFSCHQRGPVLLFQAQDTPSLGQWSLLGAPKASRAASTPDSQGLVVGFWKCPGQGVNVPLELRHRCPVPAGPAVRWPGPVVPEFCRSWRGPRSSVPPEESIRATRGDSQPAPHRHWRQLLLSLASGLPPKVDTVPVLCLGTWGTEGLQRRSAACLRLLGGSLRMAQWSPPPPPAQQGWSL